MMKQPDWGMETKKISQFDWPTGDTSCGHGKQISVHTRELPPETDSCKRFALVSNQLDMREQKSGKSFVAQHIFSLEIVGADEGALLRVLCCRSKLPRVYRL